MDKISGGLYIFFEDPFWVGIFERLEKGKLSVCKVTFGSEPTNGDVYKYILENYCKLRFSPAVNANVKRQVKNPKRMKREVHKQVQNVYLGTKSQQALKLQHEQTKQMYKAISKEKKELEKQHLFELRQRKKKEKHKGR